MAKTNWQMDDTVMPADLNEIGVEINEKKEKTKRLPDNADLNTYITEGIWYTNSNASAATVLNSPTILSFNIEVIITSGSNRVQIIRENNAGIVYGRRYNGTSFTDWVRTPVSDKTKQIGLNPELHNGWRRYNSFAEIGITAGSETFDSIFNAMEPMSILMVYISSGILYPAAGHLIVEKLGTTVAWFYFFENTYNEFTYKSRYNSTATTKFAGWKREAYANGTLQNNLNASLHNGWRRYNTYADFSFSPNTASTPEVNMVNLITSMADNTVLHTILANPETSYFITGYTSVGNLIVERYNTNRIVCNFYGINGFHVQCFYGTSSTGTNPFVWRPVAYKDGTLQTGLNAERVGGRLVSDLMLKAGFKGYSLVFFVNAATGNDFNEGNTAVSPLLTINEALIRANSMYGLDSGKVIINLATGVYDESVIIQDPARSYTIYGDDSSPANVLIKHITINSASTVRITGVTIPATTGQSAQIYINETRFAIIDRVVMVGSKYGIYVQGGSRVKVTGSTFNNTIAAAIYAAEMSEVLSNANNGTGNNKVCSAVDGSLVIKNGTQPAASSPDLTTNGGAVRATV